jgi:hypothetical protein
MRFMCFIWTHGTGTPCCACSSHQVDSLKDEAQPLLIKVVAADNAFDSLTAAEAKYLSGRKMIAKE